MTLSTEEKDVQVDAREFVLLQALKVKGFADAAALADATGIAPADAEELLEVLQQNGYVKMLVGRLTGARLTPEGQTRRAALIEQRATDGLDAALEAFRTPNASFKELTTRWQTGDHGPDAQRDVLEGLVGVHSAVTLVISEAAGADPRFARYQTRLDDALARLRAGDPDALARPMTRSYHDVWMELHEDLLCTLGTARIEADGD